MPPFFGIFGKLLPQLAFEKPWGLGEAANGSLYPEPPRARSFSQKLTLKLGSVVVKLLRSPKVEANQR